MLGRYRRTIGLLRLAQVGARVRLRGQRTAIGWFPGASEALLRGLAPSIAGWPEGFVPLDARTADPGIDFDRLARGVVGLLGEERDLRRPADPALGGPALDWAPPDAPLLWRYHLHYLDWLWPLAGHPTDGRPVALGRHYASWRASTPFGHGPAWAPYVVALRAWTLCGLLGPLERSGQPDVTGDGLREDLGLHQAFLRTHLERDVGGNHLVKNLKALVGLAIAEAGRPRARAWLDAFATEIDRQVLPDGGHIERSPAYHCQVLGDVLDVVALARAAGETVPSTLTSAADAMTGWLAAVLGPGRSVPLLNDGYPVPARLVDALCPVPTTSTVPTTNPGTTASPGTSARAADGEPTLRLLAESGLAVLRAGPWRVLADVGRPCPDDLPAHAHADTLSFLLWYGDRPVLVDSGTSTNEPGHHRPAERSTAGHSTIRIDDVDSTEVWGTFRAGRRARPTIVAASSRAGSVDLTAAHDGYRHLPGRPTHQRSWRVTPTGVTLADEVTGAGHHRVEVFFTLPPGASAEPDGTGALRVTVAPLARGAPDRVQLTLRTASGRLGRWQIRPGTRATGWNRARDAPTACFLVRTELPFTVHTEISLAAVPAIPPQPGEAAGLGRAPTRRPTDVTAPTDPKKPVRPA
ncbi:MAG: heparinase II/III domain-containing protein [Frankia sp.]